MTTDYSIKIEHRRFEEPGKRAAADIGGGGPPVTLYSKRGKLRLMRLQKDFTEAE